MEVVCLTFGPILTSCISTIPTLHNPLTPQCLHHNTIDYTQAPLQRLFIFEGSSFV